MAERRAYKRLGNVDFARVKFFAEWLLERAEVYANADRNLFLLCRAGDCLNPVARTDVAGVKPKRISPSLDGGERAAVVEVDVCDERNRRGLLYLAEDFSRLDVRNGQAEDIAAKRCA